MTDAAFMQEHAAGIEVMAGGLGVSESMIRLGEAMREAFGHEMPDSVLAALGYVALQLGEARANEQRWHGEARESTRLLHASNNVRETLNRELGAAEEAHAEALAESLINAAESEERRTMLRNLADSIGAPRDALQAGAIAAAQWLLGEPAAARRARLLASLARAGKMRESGNG